MRYRGHSFGLNFSSDRVFVELAAPNSVTQIPSIDIHWGNTPDHLASPMVHRGLYQAKPNEYLLSLPQVARYHVTPTTITVSPAPGAADETIRLFLFGSAMGALLHMNGILALHGSAVRLAAGGAAVFCGVSTAGKSTLAAALSQRNYPPLADDIVAVHFNDDGRAWVHPGLAHCKLWGDAAARLGLQGQVGERLRADMDKYALAVTPWSQAEPLTRLYELATVERGEISLHPIRGMEKLGALARNTYRSRLIDALGLNTKHFQRIGALAPQVGMGRLIRPFGGDTCSALIDLLEKDWA